MKFFRLLLIVVSAQIILVGTTGAQNLTDDQLYSSEVSINTPQYPILDKQLRLGLDFGYSYRLGKFVDDIPDDIKCKMRSGLNFGADLIYFPIQEIGIGAKFSGRIFDAGTIDVNDRTQMYYFAPILSWRKFDKRGRNAWVFGVSAGFLHFKEKVGGFSGSGSISEGGVGTTFEIGYDIRASKDHFLGFKLSITNARVQLDMGHGKTATENASSIDLSIGARF